MNKPILPLTKEDKNFVNAAHVLFGTSFAQKVQELVDQVKATSQTTKLANSFF